MTEPLVVNDQIVIPRAELRFSYSRSSGPGGQNVNKLNTKATLRWSVHQSPSLPNAVRDRFVKRFANRINDAGELVLHSDTHREQARNTNDCLDRLRAMLLATARPPRPRKQTKPTRASKEKRLTQKRRRSAAKKMRRPPETD